MQTTSMACKMIELNTSVLARLEGTHTVQGFLQPLPRASMILGAIFMRKININICRLIVDISFAQSKN